MKTKNLLAKFTIFCIATYLVSCATINVNVYFPAEEVREAYTELEEKFLEDETQPDSGTTIENEADTNENDSVNIEPDNSSKKEVVYSDEPVLQSKKIIPLKKKIDLDISEVALAAGDIKEQIKTEILKFPDVVAAYKSRDARQLEINQLLTSGIAGESNIGLVVGRGNLDADGQSLINSENNDRNTIINGMAKAIIKINKVDVTPENIKKVYPEAAEQFAEARRNQAPSGTPIQLPSGKWGKKR